MDFDSVCGEVDNCSDHLNTDGDAQGNACDMDDGNDGVDDIDDICPLDASNNCAAPSLCFPELSTAGKLAIILL